MSDKKMNKPKQNYAVNTTIVDTLWDKNADLSEDDSSMEKSLNMFREVTTILIVIVTCCELLIDMFDKSNPSCIDAFKIGM